MTEEVKDNQTTEAQKLTSNYRSIFKATSLFGGVQVYNILIGIIRSKFVAILLGPAGMGIQGLYHSALDLIKRLSSFGLEQSAVRDISEANGSRDIKRISRTISTLRRLVWFTGILGLIITLVLSPLLSRITFGNSDYTWGFVILSSTLLFDRLCAGQKSLLQGMRRLKDLAKASAIGSTVGLFVSIPLYYWVGVKGIVPTIVLVSITSMMLSWYYSSKVKVERVEISTKDAFYEGKSMMKMGLAMSYSGLLASLFAYIIRWFIRERGGIEEVGYFAAGFTIMNTYVGMVFSAMGTDYYPRLAAINKDNEKCREVINQQGEVAVLILAPIIISCVLFMPFFIRLIYSDKFQPANDFILIAIIGTLFKAASWVVSFVLLAKAESRIFVINETISNLYCLLLNLIGYYFLGLTGLGISYLVGYICYLIQVYIVAHLRYGFCFSVSFVQLYSIQLVMIGCCFFLVMMWHSYWALIPKILLFVLCVWYSLKQLDQRMNIVLLIKQKIRR